MKHYAESSQLADNRIQSEVCFSEFRRWIYLQIGLMHIWATRNGNGFGLGLRKGSSSMPFELSKWLGLATLWSSVRAFNCYAFSLNCWCSHDKLTAKGPIPKPRQKRIESICLHTSIQRIKRQFIMFQSGRNKTTTQTGKFNCLHASEGA